MQKFGPWKCGDCGQLMDVMTSDIAAAKTDSREHVLWLFDGIKAAHAEWLKEHNLSGKSLRRAGSPFREAYDDVERWLAETAPRKHKQAKRGFIYVMGMEDDLSVVKIGFTTNPDDRLSSIQTASHRPVSILAMTKGTPAMEKELHRRFAPDHIRGEWFRRTGAVEVFIAANASKA